MKPPAKCMLPLSPSFLILLGCSTLLSGCCCFISQEGGVGVYAATASTKEGREFVEKYEVKYICGDVWSIFFADISRSESGVFAIDVEVSEDGSVRFKPLPAVFTSLYGLEPRFAWWQEHGIWIILAPLILFFVLCAVAGVVNVFTRLSARPKARYF